MRIQNFLVLELNPLSWVLWPSLKITEIESMFFITFSLLFLQVVCAVNGASSYNLDFGISLRASGFKKEPVSTDIADEVLHGV